MLGTSSEHTYRQNGGEFPPRKKPWAMSQYEVTANGDGRSLYGAGQALGTELEDPTWLPGGGA